MYNTDLLPFQVANKAVNIIQGADSVLSFEYDWITMDKNKKYSIEHLPDCELSTDNKLVISLYEIYERIVEDNKSDDPVGLNTIVCELICELIAQEKN